MKLRVSLDQMLNTRDDHEICYFVNVDVEKLVVEKQKQ